MVINCTVWSRKLSHLGGGSGDHILVGFDAFRNRGGSISEDSCLCVVGLETYQRREKTLQLKNTPFEGRQTPLESPGRRRYDWA